MHCSSCTKDAMVEIWMTVGGAAVLFRRCGRCESQSWETPQGRVPLTHVLDLARTR